MNSETTQTTTVSKGDDLNEDAMKKKKFTKSLITIGFVIAAVLAWQFLVE